jgi:hypothetical protein
MCQGKHHDGIETMAAAILDDTSIIAKWVARGFTDDITTCEHCGRAELKGTVRLEAITQDNESLGEIYAGVVCAGRLSGRKAAEIRTEANRADRDRERAIRDAWHAWSDEHTHFACTTRDAHFGGWRPCREVSVFLDSPEFKAAEAAWLRANPCPPPPSGYEHAAEHFAALAAIGG